MASPRDYVVYVFGLPNLDVPGRPALKTQMDMHGGERETSLMLTSARPDLVHQDRATEQSGADQNRLSALPGSVYTGIWWYARFPNHYHAGHWAEAATKELWRIRPERVVPPNRLRPQSHQSRHRIPKTPNPILQRRPTPLDTKQ